MFSDFRRIFKPTKEERKKDLELFLKMHTNNIGRCSTCIHKIESDAPGFVTDYGSCDVKSPVFFKKVCAIEEEPECPQYEEDTAYPELLKQQIKLLDVEYPPLNDSFSHKKDICELKNRKFPSVPDEVFGRVKNTFHEVADQYFEMIREELLKYDITDAKDYSRVSIIRYQTHYDSKEHPFTDYYIDEQFKFRVYATVEENFDNHNLIYSYTMNYRIEEKKK